MRRECVNPVHVWAHPNRRFLYAANLISANQGGENVVVFRIDRHTGHLTTTGSQQPVAQAGGLAFVKAQ